MLAGVSIFHLHITPAERWWSMLLRVELRILFQVVWVEPKVIVLLKFTLILIHYNF